MGKRDRAWVRAAALGGVASLLVVTGALACDGSSYSLSVAPGAVASGGGLMVRLDKAKLLDEELDKYWISVKDDGQILADHVLLVQRDTITLKTKCGNVTIGADRKSLFSGSTLTVNWSYF